jgi:hypothetical protein
MALRAGLLEGFRNNGVEGRIHLPGTGNGGFDHIGSLDLPGRNQCGQLDPIPGSQDIITICAYYFFLRVHLLSASPLISLHLQIS